MKTRHTAVDCTAKAWQPTTAATCLWTALLLCVAIATNSGCGTPKHNQNKQPFFTSGNREADQRAGQRMAKAEQLEGSGEGAAEKKKSDKEGAQKAEDKRPLYERLGGEQGIAKIVDDFLARAMADPRVNWDRNGVKKGGWSFHRNDSVSWKATPQSTELLKKHLAQFFAVTTGGPAHYEGKDIKSTHASMHITNAEFDAAMGDLKASLDKLQIANREQKELLAVVESTRPEIVTVR